MPTTPREPWERYLPLLFALLALGFLAPLWPHAFRFADKSDWRHFQSATEIARRSVVWFHQVPLWNPYFCGGEVLWANPQSEVAAPTFLLALVFGTALGVKLSLALYLFFAFDGMYRLARSLALAPVSSLLAAVLFGGSGWFALHFLVGHTNFAAAGLLPYLVLFYRRGLQDLAWAIPLGAIAAWILALGGSAIPAIALILLLTIAVTDAVARRSLAPFAVLAAGAGCAALLGAVRLLPVMEFAIRHPRRQWETDSTALPSMLLDALRWKSDVPLAGHRYRFHEYGWHVAYVSVPLIAASLALPAARRWWIVWLVGASIVAGAAIPYGPWWLLKHLPIYRDLRVPSRYTLLFAFSAALVAAFALDWLTARMPSPRARRIVPLVIVALAAADCALFFVQRLGAIPFPALHVAAPSEPFSQEQGHWSTMMPAVLENRGVLSCDEEAPLQRARELDVDAVPQVRLADPSAGAIVSYRWTPNEIIADVALTAPTKLLVNENWNEHWKTSAGRIAKHGPKNPADADGGQLAVELPAAGSQHVRVYYRPSSFIAGAVVTLLSTPALALLFWRRRRRDAAIRA